MTALVIPPAQILAELQRTDPDHATRIYAHRRTQGTPAGYALHVRNGSQPCSSCRSAYNAAQRRHRRSTAQPGPMFPERTLLALADDSTTDPARAETLAYYGHPLSTAVHGAVHTPGGDPVGNPCNGDSVHSATDTAA
jgi:predicted anti-sigma-YlaC factor YlaD